MVIKETVDGLKGYRFYASNDCDVPTHEGEALRTISRVVPGGENLISGLLCRAVPKNTYRRVLSVNFETGIVEYEVSEEEQAKMLRRHVVEWCTSMIGRRSPTDAEEKLWNACLSLGLTSGR